LTEAEEALDEHLWEMRIGNGGKPEGFVVEIADFIIRVCDMTRALGLELRAGWSPAIPWFVQAGRITGSRASCLRRARHCVDRATEAARKDEWQAFAAHLFTAVLLAAATTVDLGDALSEALLTKLAYNESRPHRHGGLRA